MSDVTMKMKLSPTDTAKLWTKSCRQEDEITRLKAANRDLQDWFDDARATAEQAQARVAELTAIESLFIAAAKKAESNGYGQDSEHRDDSWIDDLGNTLDYAQRLRQQASELEAGGGHAGNQ